MKLAVSGKGGSGKTTISGTLARLAARRGTSVLAIDADSNPNLALTLGLNVEDLDSLVPVSHDVMEHVQVNEKATLRLARSFEDVAAGFGRRCPDNVLLMMVGRVHGAGKG